MGQSTFIEKHALWNDEQKDSAVAVKRRIQETDLLLIRLAWADTHGYSRAKSLTIPTFLNTLSEGYNINVATTTLDSANARTFSSFSRGGGFGLEEMTGSPNITIVPDPTTFRVLPWAPRVGWVLCDEYFKTGDRYPFSPRGLLKKQLQRLEDQGMSCLVGLEIEWYLTRLAEDHLSNEHIGVPGKRGRPIHTFPVEPGYSYHSESNKDLMQPVITELMDAFEKLDLPLRSIENEWGPGQLECTFSVQDGLKATDNAVLFRTATRQICRRLGYLSTFMCRPALPGYYSSGWHLHQSIVETATGDNLFVAKGEPLSPFGRSYLAGLLEHCSAACAFATPTVNGYKRFRPNSLAPDRASWGLDNRGTMIRVLGEAADATTHLENRVGEPAANPYLYLTSQIISGLDGVERNLDPGSQDFEPYNADRTLLPTSLVEALDSLADSSLFRRQIGDLFLDYFLKVKRNEASRFLQFLEGSGIETSADEVTEWEQNEYFDFF